MGRRGILRRFPSALMAWRNLGRSRVRTGLATLGIVIGVIAIASLGIAGAAIHHQATADLESLTTQVTVSSGEDSPTDGVTTNQIDEIRRLSSGAEVVPQRSNFTTLSARNGREVTVGVTGVTQASTLYDVSEGEAPDRLRSGALISASTATKLGLEIGDPVKFDGSLYRIKGLIESERGYSVRGSLVVPPSAFSDRQHYDTVTVIADDGKHAQRTADAIEERFNDGDDEEVRVRSNADAQERVSEFMSTLNLALLGIGSISLIVASVAILNVMLMSTIERRGEIGVLRAVGIRRGEVLRMILTEAALIGVVGGVIGAAGSLLVGLALFDLLVGDATLVFKWHSAKYLVYGFGFAVVASVLSGLYPAWKAANDRPVEALRG
ncbi:ABC transporter permease [Halopiger djelfimassiliensis]|uniref:ABC transporter permease n=1 Tax=Halopiger djelfimassiliensis TaxID=1293047 RepID=UPI000677A8EE|nr:ABC transporter permease [Halopiger djelfimassiliensis]